MNVLNAWFGVVYLEINSASNVGGKIVQGTAEHYYTFHTSIVSTTNPYTTAHNTVTG